MFFFLNLWQKSLMVWPTLPSVLSPTGQPSVLGGGVCCSVKKPKKRSILKLDKRVLKIWRWPSTVYPPSRTDGWPVGLRTDGRVGQIQKKFWYKAKKKSNCHHKTRSNFTKKYKPYRCVSDYIIQISYSFSIICFQAEKNQVRSEKTEYKYMSTTTRNSVLYQRYNSF